MTFAWIPFVRRRGILANSTTSDQPAQDMQSQTPFGLRHPYAFRAAPSKSPLQAFHRSTAASTFAGTEAAAGSAKGSDS